MLDTLDEADQVRGIAPGWLAAMAGLQLLSLACLWELQRIALHTRDMTSVATSQLAGNALAKVAPGGGAMGAALQYRMLVQSGLPRAASASALTATNLLVFAVVLALPVAGGPGDRRRRGEPPADPGHADRGAGVHRPVRGRAWRCWASTARCWPPGGWSSACATGCGAGPSPLRGLPDRLVAERDRILTTLGRDWKRALAATVGRWAFDYATLLAALAAVGSNPRPSLVLLAFCAAQVLAQIPFTPGGLGFVEAGLTATLALAGVSAAGRAGGHVRLPAVLLLADDARGAGRAGAAPAGARGGGPRRRRLRAIGRLLYSGITSLDGYTEDPSGDFEWSAPDEEVHRFVNDLTRPVGTHLLGRRMYETMAYWDTDDPDRSDFEHDFAAIWQAADKVVYSRTLPSRPRPDPPRARVRPGRGPRPEGRRPTTS